VTPFALRAAAPVVLTVLALAACSTSADVPPTAPSARQTTATATPAAHLSGTLTVFAAASLTETFTQLGDRFMAAHPGLTVTFNFGGSSALAAQIVSGAPADVFAAASPATMRTVVDAGDDANEPEVFARNTLEIAVPPDNPAHITGLSDFTRPELTIALCAPEVPCGAAAQQVFTAAGLVPAPDTLEPDVKSALSKVELGEVDGALVYKTDVIAAAGRVRGIEFPEASGAVNDYPITVLTKATNSAAAAAFVELVRSPDGQQALAAAGFASH